MSLVVAKGLAIASTALLLIYGADVALPFLPLSAMIRGIAFGAFSVAMLTAAYLISRRVKSNLVTVLLMFNGAIIIAGVGAVAVMPTQEQTAAISSTVIGTIALGGWVLALGIIKGLKSREAIKA